MKISILISTILLASLSSSPGQVPVFRPDQIASMVAAYKLDPRGPYRDIRWFCKDGSINPPKEPCDKPGGVQRARMKQEIVDLAKKEHIFLGQILATTPYVDFWDEVNSSSRLKQFQLENFLFSADNGWILRKARYYRGARQAEDEAKWGRDFFEWLLKDEQRISEHFFLIKQAVRDLPHRTDDNLTLRIRAVSKSISEAYPEFMDLRIKIHGQPHPEDLNAVRNFQRLHQEKLSASIYKLLDDLVKDMNALYQTVDLTKLGAYSGQLSSENEVGKAITKLVDEFKDVPPSLARLNALSETMLAARNGLSSTVSPDERLAIFDALIEMEEIILLEAQTVSPETLEDLLTQIKVLIRVAAATGWIELWEWEKVEEYLTWRGKEEMSLNDLDRQLTLGRSVIEWSTGMGTAIWNKTIERYGTFEPLTYGFLDDRIRSSVLLPLGEKIGNLGDLITQFSGRSNLVMGIKEQGLIRGLNPGFAKGILVVVSEDPDNIKVSPDKIYIFDRSPADLKPVAGIATVSEGNAVSHVQLLARNLGIPNAVFSRRNLLELKAYSGKEVFYAVSPNGTVIMKPAKEMSEEERKLFAKRVRPEERIEVPTQSLNLAQKNPVNLREVKATDSGNLCGPKAANLGQLKSMFPENVVEGFVIPFGVFRDHMEQSMPGTEMSYWGFMNQIFDQGEAMLNEGITQEKVDAYTLEGLDKLQTAIRSMPLKQEFVEEMKVCFEEVLGDRLGKVPVFLRSDTNMEDLRDFTGAGLNLTLFNVVEPDKILQGIKDVWASPYTERSYSWRQRYLINPENVYPSILVIPSVDVDASGVMITKGIINEAADDLTVAFSRGAGGAVDGQVAETWLLVKGGPNILLSPAREPFARRLPADGGSYKEALTFNTPILQNGSISALRKIAHEIKDKFPFAAGSEAVIHDIELGFKDGHLWLFQVRPFVENKNALGSLYLQSINAKLPVQYYPVSYALQP